MKADGGWWKFYRSIEDHWIGSDLVAYRLFGYLMSKAQYQDSRIIFEGQILIISRGQLLTSIRRIVDDLKLDRSAIQRRLKLLEADGTIETQPRHKGTIVTICNFEYYQGNENQDETQLRRESTTNQPQNRHETSLDSTTRPHHIKKERISNKERRKEENALDPTPSGEVVALKPSSLVWQIYLECFVQKYGTEPKRNATVNGQIANLVKRLGEEDAKAVVRFYFTHNNRFYIQTMHSVGPLLKDCEKLYAEMNANIRITPGLSQHAELVSNNEQVVQQYLRGKLDGPQPVP